jgi:predicted RecA/RadA family phage recombinase
MAAIELHNGSPLMVDYTPSGAAVSAGDGVIVGGKLRIAHRDIEDGRLGALALGKAIYRVPLTAANTFSDGDDVPFNDTTNAADALGTATVGLTAVKDAASGDKWVYCVHDAQT